jgi:hypothetical protein
MLQNTPYFGLHRVAVLRRAHTQAGFQRGVEIANGDTAHASAPVGHSINDIIDYQFVQLVTIACRAPARAKTPHFATLHGGLWAYAHHLNHVVRR